MITPVILAGGSGTRLWPASRRSYPKQFLDIFGEQSFFQNALDRVSGDMFKTPLIMTSEDFRFIVSEQITGQINQRAKILIEPCLKNTAASILAASIHIARIDPDRLMLVCPSDHLIPDITQFHESVRNATERALAGDIVTFGIRPRSAETGYGYIEPEEDAPISRVRSFVEKPSAERAEALCGDGRHLWNAGIFLFRAQTMIDQFADYAPEYLDPVKKSYESSWQDLEFIRLCSDPWKKLPAQSIDYALLEKSDEVSVALFDGAWSDLGDWEAIWRQELTLEPNDDNCAIGTNATALDCQNILVRNENPDAHVVTLGVRDLIVVNTADSILIADISKAQDVGRLVDTLRTQGIAQADTFRRDHRPWGWFESIAISERFQVKRIVVHPGASLSLQSHLHRAEHWVVVEGTARVTIGDQTQLVSENQSVYVPLGEKHRLENPGRLPMILIEVQTGAYLGEDDIIRYEDRYARLAAE